MEAFDVSMVSCRPSGSLSECRLLLYRSRQVKGQVSLFVTAEYSRSLMSRAQVIHGHFATLAFELRFGSGLRLIRWNIEATSDGGVQGVKPSEPSGCLRPWECRLLFPAMDDDVLLYLSLLGGKLKDKRDTSIHGSRPPIKAVVSR